MLQNAYFLAKIGADTAENEQHFAEILHHHPRLRALEPLAHRLPRVLGQLAVEDEGLDAELRPEQRYLGFLLGRSRLERESSRFFSLPICLRKIHFSA